jgi:hypothetical protein
VPQQGFSIKYDYSPITSPAGCVILPGVFFQLRLERKFTRSNPTAGD